MSDPFVGEIRMFSFNWAPKNWASCSGQSLTISQNQALYSLLSTQFGGDGRTNFNLPDFRGRMPINSGRLASQGVNYVQGQTGGSENVTLTTTNLPQHNHTLVAVSSPGTVQTLTNPVLFAGSGESTYINSGTAVALNPGTCGPEGGNQGHSNIQPSLCVGFCIALLGVYPSRN
jgi:microcystin-dependent protein